MFALSARLDLFSRCFALLSGRNVREYWASWICESRSNSSAFGGVSWSYLSSIRVAGPLDIPFLYAADAQSWRHRWRKGEGRAERISASPSCSVGLLRKSEHTCGHFLLLLPLLRRQGYQQGPGARHEDTDHEDHAHQGLRLFKHDLRHWVRGDSIEIFCRTGTGTYTRDKICVSLVEFSRRKATLQGCAGCGRNFDRFETLQLLTHIECLTLNQTTVIYLQIRPF